MLCDTGQWLGFPWTLWLEVNPHVLEMKQCQFFPTTLGYFL